MTLRDLEFSIAQYADGTLPVEQRAALEARLAGDENARSMLEAYRGVDAAITAVRADAVPAVRWDKLAARISAAVSALPAPAAAEPVSEELEFAVAQYADGSLPTSERAALVMRIAESPALADLLIEYQSVDAGLRDYALPAVQWDKLAGRISAAVTAHATAGDLSEEKAFAVAQYADGTLPAEGVAAVEAELSVNSTARLALADERALTGTVATLRDASQPAVKWDRLATHLSGAVANEANRSGDRGAAPYRLFSILRSPMRLAAAASVLLAVGLGIRLMQPQGTPVTPIPPPPTTMLVVTGPTIGGVGGNATIDVAVGPPAAVAGKAPQPSGLTDDFATRPSRTIIAGGLEPEQPREEMPGHPY